jgi:hypothetical protein
MPAPLGENPRPYIEEALRELRHAENHLVEEYPKLAEEIRQLRLEIRRKYLGL